MIITDRVYGDVEITEQVLIDIINSPTLERLKDISQQGLPQGYYNTNTFSRYEHSIGVLILLRKLEASIEEQIAGLIHDISHSTFSHAIDWVLGNPEEQDHQDNEFLSYFYNSEIPQILKKYNFNIDNISDLDSFSLLEQPAPSLCADRIDYTLRELINQGFNDEVKLMVNSLINIEGRIVFTNIEHAELFATKYCNCNKNFWMGKNGMLRYHLLAQILKLSLEKNYILKDDFSKIDSYVINKLYDSKDESVISILELLKTDFVVVDTHRDDVKGVKLKGKFRYIDPEILIEDEDANTKVVQLTSISQIYKDMLEMEKQASQEDIIVKIKDF
ncbi:MAG: HD domain-containing protein [Nanoarchaeota archaeon]|nr:HD domain-containing protein [Nanoarchaeota archaeon]